MGITMVSFKKEEIQYFIDTIQEALTEEFEDQSVRSELLESKKLLVAAMKGVPRAGSVLLTPGECMFAQQAVSNAAHDDYLDLSIKEELSVASGLLQGMFSNPTNKVAV